MSGEPWRREFDVPGETGRVSALVWDEAGTGAPLLIFLHANGFNAQTYRRLLARVADEATIVAPDLRGHGRTALKTDWRGLRNWYVYRDDLNALRDVLGTERPVVLAGHSLGGTTALLSATSRPDQIAGLFLVEPVIIPRLVRWTMSAARRLGMRTPVTALSKGALRRRVRWPDRAAMFDAYRKRRAFRYWTDDAIRDYIEGGTRLADDGTVELTCDPRWEAATYGAQAHDPWAGLDALDFPVFVLTGTFNSTLPPALAARIASRLGHAAQERIPDSGHFLPMEKPELVADELGGFLRRLA